MRDNILVGEYTFMSEGIQSIRQVAFKFEDSAFVEGYGETYTKEGKEYFKDIDSLKFNDSMKLTALNCK